MHRLKMLVDVCHWPLADVADVPETASEISF